LTNQEKQKVIELRIRMRNEEMERDKERENQRKSKQFVQPDLESKNEQKVQKPTSSPVSFHSPNFSDLDIEEDMVRQAIEMSLNEPQLPVQSNVKTPQRFVNISENSTEEESSEEPSEEQEDDKQLGTFPEENEDYELALALSLSLEKM
jgi:hypothetical protein